MTEYLSPDELLIGEDDTEDVQLSKGTVKVRGLSRQEWFFVGKTSEGDGDVAEATMLSIAMVEPAMRVKQVEAWRKRPGAATDVARVTEAVRRLTGVAEGAGKSDVAPAGD